MAICAGPAGALCCFDLTGRGGGAQAAAAPGQPPERALALRRLAALAEVMNPAVGDALSGVLAVEAVLRLRGWGLDEWDALYSDLPSRQLKVKARGGCVPPLAERVCPAGGLTCTRRGAAWG